LASGTAGGVKQGAAGESARPRGWKPLMALAVGALLWCPGAPSGVRAGDEFMVGALVNDLTAHRCFGGAGGGTCNRYSTLRAHGFGWCLTWVLTTQCPELASLPAARWKELPAWKLEYWGSLEYATETLRAAQEAGLRLQVLLALSHEPTHPGKQHIPPEWRGLSDAALALALEGYCEKTARHFAAQGLKVECYTVGNEIEFGILKTTPEHPDWVPPGIDVFSDPTFVSTKVWPREALLLKAAIRGIKRANPEAKIVLHPDSVGRTRNNRHLRSFLAYMVDHGVAFDYASFTDPQLDAVLVEGSRPYFRSAAFASLADYVAGLGKRMLVGEFYYPHSPTLAAGEPDPGYPFTPGGQAQWIRDFLQTVSTHKAVAGVFYWYPEYDPGYSVKPAMPFNSTGLFQDGTNVQPAMREFGRLRANP
jgi:arabinogalactan endo-1,4-beta-galactosidase